MNNRIKKHKRIPCAYDECFDVRQSPGDIWLKIEQKKKMMMKRTMVEYYSD